MRDGADDGGWWRRCDVYEPQREKRAPNEDRNHPAHPQSNQSFRCPHDEPLHHWLPKMRPVEILIRLREMQNSKI